MTVDYAANCIPLLIQQNVDGSDFFNRSWEEFKVGFNDTRGNYWLGNDLLSQLTQNGHYRLRFDLLERGSPINRWHYPEYSSFVVSSEASNYRLKVTGYQFSGHNDDTRDAFYHYHNAMFSTYDRDNDQSSDNCAVLNGGGFWYNNCNSVGVNAARDFTWRWRPPVYGLNLQATRMWLLCWI